MTYLVGSRVIFSKKLYNMDSWVELFAYNENLVCPYMSAMKNMLFRGTYINLVKIFIRPQRWRGYASTSGDA